jgi:guanylate kinase
VDGVDYNFVSRVEFEKRLQDGAFVEHATYGGELYGTECSNFERAKSNQLDLLLDIDVQGVTQLREKYGEQVHVIFVAPPSLEILEQRFRNRPGSTEEKLQQRLKIAHGELRVLNEPGFSNFKVINDRLEIAVASVLEHLSLLNA